MAKDKGANATPARLPPALKKQSSSAKNQSSILGFFSKGPAGNGSAEKNSSITIKGTPSTSDTSKDQSSPVTKQPAFRKTVAKNLTPVPSSDAAAPSSPGNDVTNEVEYTGLPSSSTPAKSDGKQDTLGVMFSSPSRKVSPYHARRRISYIYMMKARKVINYAESADEGDEDDVIPATKSNKRKSSRRRLIHESDEDDFAKGLDGSLEDDLDGDSIPTPYLF